MSIRVKICGMTNRRDIEAAVEFGADAVGFILYPKSTRYVSPEKLVSLTAGLPPYVQRVAVSVNLSILEIESLDDKIHFDVWQLHGQETPESCVGLKPRRVVKALGLPMVGGVFDPAKYPVDAFLLDKASPQHGGTGETFDWKLALEFKRSVSKPVILAGGLNLDNLARAVETVQPYAVDVSSGVESSPGVKDHAKMKELIELCHRL